MTSLNARDRDEFLKALDEARRAAMGDAQEPDSSADAPPAPPSSPEFRRAIERLASRLRSYISAGFLARLYADDAPTGEPEPEPQPEPKAEPPPPLPPRSDHEVVVGELHLTPDLTAHDLARIRREFAKVHHPDRVAAPCRAEATRRMTIANVLIDEALRIKKARMH